MPLSKAYSLNFVFGRGGGNTPTSKNENENSRWKFFSRKSSSKKHRSTAALFTCRSHNKVCFTQIIFPHHYIFLITI